MTPAMEAHWRATASSKRRSICPAAPPTSPSTASAGGRRLRTATVANRRTRSMLSTRDTVTPGASAGDEELGGLAVHQGGHDEARRPRPPPRPAPCGPRARSPRPAGSPSRVTAPGRAEAPGSAEAPGGDGLTAEEAGQVRSPAGPRSRTRPARRPPRWSGSRGPGETQLPISSATRVRSTRPWPDTLPPPSSSGTSSEVHPSSAPCRHHAAGKPAGSFSAHSRTVGSGHGPLQELGRRLDEQLLVLCQLYLHSSSFPAVGTPPTPTT